MSPRERRRSPLLAVLGVLLVVAAAAGVAYPLWWQHRSSTTGAKLLREHLPRAGTSPTATAGAGCRAALPARNSTSGRLAGIVEIPRLHVKAPVLQGLSDPVLNVAVGHDPATPWPGSTGESIVEAHDVSYFSGIDGLRTGDRVIWVDGCRQTTFTVTRTEVSQPGVLLNPPPQTDRGLALVTCYPTNALFWTPNRFIVETSFQSRQSLSTTPSAPVDIPHLKVPAPPDLVAQGLTLQQNPILLGTLSLAGSPAPEFRHGPGPLDVEADALESYFGAQKAIAESNPTWWKALSVPGLAMPRAWSSGVPVSITITVEGRSVTGVVLSSSAVTVQLTVRHGLLLISSIRLA